MLLIFYYIVIFFMIYLDLSEVYGFLFMNKIF